MRKTFIVTTCSRMIAEWLAVYILISSMTGRCSVITGALCVCSIVVGTFLGATVLRYFPTCAGSIAVVISVIACVICALSYHGLNTVDVVVVCACSGLMMETFGGDWTW